jgi:sugar phosphate permease
VGQRGAQDLLHRGGQQGGVSGQVARWSGLTSSRSTPPLLRGSLLAATATATATAVAGIATAPTLPCFSAAWVLTGVAMAGTLYPPAFAALTHWWAPTAAASGGRSS